MNLTDFISRLNEVEAYYRDINATRRRKHRLARPRRLAERARTRPCACSGQHTKGHMLTCPKSRCYACGAFHEFTTPGLCGACKKVIPNEYAACRDVERNTERP